MNFQTQCHEDVIFDKEKNQITFEPSRKFFLAYNLGLP